jgi:hypothetical protein
MPSRGWASKNSVLSSPFGPRCFLLAPSAPPSTAGRRSRWNKPDVTPLPTLLFRLSADGRTEGTNCGGGWIPPERGMVHAANIR